MRLYKLAVGQGNASGQVDLGLLYEQGRGGLPKDDREAGRLYKLAADQGDADGQVNLGVLLPLWPWWPKQGRPRGGAPL